MQGGEVAQPAQPGEDVVADPYGLDVAFAAVDDPMPDRVDGAQIAHRGGNLLGVDRRPGSGQLLSAAEPVVVEHAQLEAARTGIDHEHAHCSGACARPRPVAHVGWIVAHLARVGPMAQTLVDHLLP